MANDPLIKLLLLAMFVAFGFSGFAQQGKAGDSLRKEILCMDAALFDAFNSQDLETMKKVFSEDMEFYHDRGGLSDYRQNVAAFQRNFSSGLKVHRELLPGSTEIHPVGDYGAIQTGLHRFCHQENGKEDCGTFKFLHIWKRTPEGWRVTRIVSYGH